MEAVRTAVNGAIDGINRQRSVEEQLTKSEATVLSGADAVLDSLGLVTLIVAVEQQVETGCGRRISLTDAGLFSNAGAVVRLGDLVACVSRLVNEAADG